MLGLNVVKNSAYVSDEQVYRQKAVFAHVQFTRFTQAHVKYLAHTQALSIIVPTKKWLSSILVGHR